jgi:hypothetical protein
MLLPNNKVPAWGSAYSLADEFSGISKDHPPSAFIQNIDDTTAPPQGTLAYAQKLLSLGLKPVVHMYLLRSRLIHALVAFSCNCHLFVGLFSNDLAVKRKRYNKGGHGFGLCQGEKTWLEVCDWPKAAQRFLQDIGMAYVCTSPTDRP